MNERHTIDHFNAKRFAYATKSRKSFLFYNYLHLKQRLLSDIFVSGKDKKNILEIGCGTAPLVKEISCFTPNYNYVGIDLMKDFIVYATKDRNCKAKFVVANGTDLPFKDNLFDVIIMETVLHHLTDKNISLTKQKIYKTIQEVVRVSKNKAYILIREVICKNRIQAAMLFWIGSLFFKAKIVIPYFSIYKGPIVLYLTEDQLREVLSLANIKIIDKMQTKSRGSVRIRLTRGSMDNICLTGQLIKSGF